MPEPHSWLFARGFRWGDGGVCVRQRRGKGWAEDSVHDQGGHLPPHDPCWWDESVSRVQKSSLVLSLSEYSRPNRVGYANQAASCNAPVKVCFSFSKVEFSFSKVAFLFSKVAFSFSKVAFPFSKVAFSFSKVAFSFSKVAFLFYKVAFSFYKVAFSFYKVAFSFSRLHSHFPRLPSHFLSAGVLCKWWHWGERWGKDCF